MNIAPYLKEKQLDEFEMVETRWIASFRIHLERVMENYHIFDQVLPVS